MGPTLLFDKSFIQSLSVDEAVWLDMFFTINICPYFYVETLADLEKGKSQADAERGVRVIASKFPEINGRPNMFHIDLCIAELLGAKISMKGQIIGREAKPFSHNDEIGFISDLEPENEAFLRWQEEKYSEVEKKYARIWRNCLQGLNLKNVAPFVQNLEMNKRICKTREACNDLAANLIDSGEYNFDIMSLALDYLQVPDYLKQKILERWRVYNYKNLRLYTPYLAFVVQIELFFQLAVLNSQISYERNSHRADLSYLFYLPFTKIFVSKDKQQLKWCKFFVNNHQSVIGGDELKKDLADLNKFYKQNIDEKKAEQGLISLINHPPLEEDFLVSRLWDKYNKKWRHPEKEVIDLQSENMKKALLKKLSLIKNASDHRVGSSKIFDPQKHTYLRAKNIRQKKGSWYQVDKQITPQE